MALTDLAGLLGRMLGHRLVLPGTYPGGALFWVPVCGSQLSGPEGLTIRLQQCHVRCPV